jgi:hypothetical protein
MRPPIVPTALLSLLLTASTAFGQSLTFGEPFPLTNTRYGEVSAFGRLATDGRSSVLFWPEGEHIRATKIVDGERRGGRAVLDVQSTTFDAVWTGQHYLLAAQTQPESSPARIDGRLLNAAGDPVTPQFQIVTEGRNPSLATNGRSVLMLYLNAQQTALRYAALTTGGAVKPGPTPSLTIPNEIPLSYDVASNGRGFVAVATTETQTRVYFFDENGEFASEKSLSPFPLGRVTIASNGDDYFVAGSSANGAVLAMLVSEEGNISSPLTLDHALPVNGLTSVWSGDSWVVGASATGGLLHFIYVQAGVERTLGRDAPVEGAAASLVMRNGGVLASWRSTAQGGVTVTSFLPLPPNFDGDPATHAAGRQTVLATATNGEGTLVVWRETAELETTYRAGIRSRTGEWIERSLTAASSPVFSVAAASNGSNFVVVLKPANEAEMVAFRLDARVRTEGVTRLPFFVHDIAARGDDYVLVGNSTGLTLATMSSSGVVSPAVTFDESVEYPRVATNGTLTMVTWISDGCQIVCPSPVGPAYARQFNAAFAPVGPAHLLSDEFGSAAAEVTADGSSFVIAWSTGVELHSARVTAGSTAAPAVTTRVNGSEGIVDADVLRASQGLIYTWKTRSANAWTQHVELVTNSGPLRYQLPVGSHTYVPSLLTNLANGDVALLASQPNVDAPHHGSSRVMMTIGTFAGVLPAAAPPQLTAIRENGRIRLEWTAPPQAVNGYRVEYRIGDGSWHEINEWYGPNELAETLSWDNPVVAFRVRAFTDGGASNYSNIAHVGLSKRRAVRR